MILNCSFSFFKVFFPISYDIYFILFYFVTSKFLIKVKRFIQLKFFRKLNKIKKIKKNIKYFFDKTKIFLEEYFWFLTNLVTSKFNTFTFEHLHFEKNKWAILSRKCINWYMSFCITFLPRKFIKIYLLKLF